MRPGEMSLAMTVLSVVELMVMEAPELPAGCE